MAKSLQVTVTNPDDLNTLQGELVTQNYNLEILGLKNPADFRKFSKSLMMLDRILKETNDKVDNGLKEKLDKGSYGGDADDLKREIDGKEPAFSKNSGFNKEKTSEYKSGKDAEKLFTQEGAHNLYEEVNEEIIKINKTRMKRMYLDSHSNTDTIKNFIRERNIGTLAFSNSQTGDFGEYLPETQKWGNMLVLNGGVDTFMCFYAPSNTSNNLYFTSFSLNSERFNNPKWTNIWTSDNFNPATKLNTTGGILTGSLRIDADNNNLKLMSHGKIIGELISWDTAIVLYNSTAKKSIRLMNDGTANYPAENLKTEAKEVVGATNELLKKLCGIIGEDTINYIQNIGIKTINEIYIDKDTMRPYKCYNTCNDTTVTQNFGLITNKELATQNRKSKVLWNGNKIANTSSYEEVCAIPDYINFLKLNFFTNGFDVSSSHSTHTIINCEGYEDFYLTTTDRLNYERFDIKIQGKKLYIKQTVNGFGWDNNGICQVIGYY